MDPRGLTAASIAMLILTINTAHGDEISNPCGGPTAMFSLINRPTNSDSPCVVPYKHVLIEAGYQYQTLHGGGHANNYPETEVRFGLPFNNEVNVTLPNYNHQNITPKSGSAATIIGFKREFWYNVTWLIAAEILVTLPDGSNGFGNRGYGSTLNGIVNYNFTPTLTLSGELGGSTQTESNLNDGGRYKSINANAVLSWQLNERTSLYAEVYGQSRTSPSMGAGFNADTGVIYAFFKNMTADAELGQRFSGHLIGFDHYLGAGLSILF